MSQVFLLVLLFVAPRADACGFCGGDKAAAVYSYRDKQFAKREGAHYVSVELTGSGGELEFKRAVASLARIKGVFPKTVRSAFAQRAVSFVYQADIPLAEVMASFSNALPGWSMKEIEQIE